VRARPALLIALASALPRLAVLLHERASIVTNNVDKGDTFARTFLDTGTYGLIPGHPSAYTQPLYGWFLIPLYWLFGHSWQAVGIAQITVAVATALTVWRIGRRWLGPTTGLVAGLVFALHPYLIWHDVHMNREILDEFLAAAAVYLTLRAAEHFTWHGALPLGAVLGLAILGNARLELLPLVVGGYLVWRIGVSRRSLLAAGAVLAGTAVLLAPWLTRNAANVGCATVTTDARALWKANNVNTYATVKSGQWIDHVPQPRSLPPSPQDVFEHWQKTGVILPYDECAQMSMYEHKVISFWIHHPGAKAQLLPIDVQWNWQPSVVDVTDLPGAGTALNTLRSVALPVYMIPLYVLGLVGLFVVPRAIAGLALLLLGYETATAIVFIGETRYRVPWDFLIVLLASSAAVTLVSRIHARRSAPARAAAEGRLPGG
jgi:4-amino-4-deoxy-L-arabinose transferase-like glycosyltransferase